MLADHGAFVRWFILQVRQQLLQAGCLSTTFRLSVSVYEGLPTTLALLHLVQGLERQVLVQTAYLCYETTPIFFFYLLYFVDSFLVM